MKQAAGAYTMIEVPVIDYIYGDKEALIKKTGVIIILKKSLPQKLGLRLFLL
jgi:diaminopimelate dehydrogenase (EC 1.4.1.16)